MTLDEFLSELRKTPREWRTGGYECRDRIRCNNDCPITAVARLHGMSYDVNEAFQASKAIGLDGSDADNIMHNADFNTDWPLRRQLLKACGLEDAE